MVPYTIGHSVTLGPIENYLTTTPRKVPAIVGVPFHFLLLLCSCDSFSFLYIFFPLLDLKKTSVYSGLWFWDFLRPDAYGAYSSNWLVGYQHISWCILCTLYAIVLSKALRLASLSPFDDKESLDNSRFRFRFWSVVITPKSVNYLTAKIHLMLGILCPTRWVFLARCQMRPGSTIVLMCHQSPCNLRICRLFSIYCSRFEVGKLDVGIRVDKHFTEVTLAGLEHNEC